MTAPHAPNIADLINAKRASGYDGEFEAVLRQPWYCPHCKTSKTIMQTMLALAEPGSDPACVDCGKEGIRIVRADGDHVKQFRKLLNMLAPYDRSGTA